MDVINYPDIITFYEKRLNGTLIRKIVEEMSMNFYGLATCKFNDLSGLFSHSTLVCIISSEWLDRGADTLIQDLRAVKPLIHIILCITKTPAPNKEILFPLLEAADPDTFCHISELTNCLLAWQSGRSFMPSHWWTNTKERSNFEPFFGWTDLSSQERKVIRLMAEGYKSYEIAKKLFISPHTINNHKAKLSQKLNVSGGPGSLIRFVTIHREIILILEK